MAAAQASVWLDPATGGIEQEEALTVAQAVIGQWTGPGAAAALQYMPFCNGCTVDAAWGSALFGLLGERLWVWKLVPTTAAVVAVAAASASAHARQGRAAGWWVTAALVLAPPVVSQLGAHGFGNHFEGGWLAVAVLAGAAGCADRRLAGLLGLCAAACVWMLPSTVWVVPAGAVALALGAGRGAALAYALLAVVGLAAWLVGGDGLEVVAELQAYGRTLSPELGGLVPAPPARRAQAWVAAWGSMQPAQSGWLGACPWTALAVVVGLGARWRGAVWAALAVAGAGLVAVLIVAPVQLPSLAAFTPYGARYAVPAAQLASLAVGLAAATAAARGRHGLAVVLVALWGAPGLVDRAAGLATADASHLGAVDLVSWPQVRRTLLARRSVDAAAWRCGADPRCAYLQAYQRGRARGSTHCRWEDAADEGGAARLGWSHGLAAGLASCARGHDVCERFAVVVAELPSADPALLLAAAEGLRLGGTVDRACASPPALAGVVEALLPASPPYTPPADLPPEALTAWATVLGLTRPPAEATLGARRFLASTPEVLSAFATGEAARGFAVPALALGLAAEPGTLPGSMDVDGAGP